MSMNEKEQKYNSFYMDIAKRVSKMSYANRRKVGSVIVKDGNILSYGWNGMPSGFDNCCEDTLDDGETKTKNEVIHAELNSILKLAKGNESGKGATMYSTLSPCVNCSLAIQGAGITSVYYTEEYKDMSGIELLKKCGIKVNKI